MNYTKSDLLVEMDRINKQLEALDMPFRFEHQHRNGYNAIDETDATRERTLRTVGTGTPQACRSAMFVHLAERTFFTLYNDGYGRTIFAKHPVL